MMDSFKAIVLVSLIGWSAFFSSCNQKEETKQAAPMGDTILVLKHFGHDTLAKVPIDTTFTHLNMQYQVPDSADIVYFYHGSSNYLSKVDLNRHKVVYHKSFGSLESLGDAGLTNATAMVVTPKNILFFEEEFIHFFDRKGNFVKSMPINTPDQKYYLMIMQNTFLPFEKNNQVFVHAIPNIPKGSKNRSYYRKAIEAKLDLETFNIDTLPVTYLDEYSRYYCGIAFNVDRLRLNNKLYYAFQSSDSITVLDLNTYSTKNIRFASHQKHSFKRFDWEKVSTYSEQDRSDLYVTNGIYYDLGFDNRSGLFYRIYHSEIPLQNKKGDFNTYDNKGRYIVFYDRDFNYFGEAPASFLGIHFSTGTGTVIPYIKKHNLYFLSIHVKD